MKGYCKNMKKSATSLFQKLIWLKYYLYLNRKNWQHFPIVKVCSVNYGCVIFKKLINIKVKINDSLRSWISSKVAFLIFTVAFLVCLATTGGSKTAGNSSS